MVPMSVFHWHLVPLPLPMVRERWIAFLLMAIIEQMSCGMISNGIMANVKHFICDNHAVNRVPNYSRQTNNRQFHQKFQTIRLEIVFASKNH